MSDRERYITAGECGSKVLPALNQTENVSAVLASDGSKIFAFKFYVSDWLPIKSQLLYMYIKIP